MCWCRTSLEDGLQGRVDVHASGSHGGREVDLGDLLHHALNQGGAHDGLHRAWQVQVADGNDVLIQVHQAVHAHKELWVLAVWHLSTQRRGWELKSGQLRMGFDE